MQPVRQAMSVSKEKGETRKEKIKIKESLLGLPNIPAAALTDGCGVRLERERHVVRANQTAEGGRHFGSEPSCRAHSAGPQYAKCCQMRSLVS